MTDSHEDLTMFSTTQTRADDHAVREVWELVHSALPKRRRHRIFVSLIVIAGVIVAASTGAAAYATLNTSRNVVSPTTYLEPDVDPQLMQSQGVLGEIADPIIDIVDPTQGGRQVTSDGKYYGYAGMVNSPARGATVIYWVGPVQPRIQRIIDANKGMAKIEVVQAKYTLFDQENAMQTLIDATYGHTIQGATLYEMDPLPGAGIMVHYATSDWIVDRAQLRAALVKIARMPVTVVADGGPPDDLILTVPNR
jgi:hypothetical protein